MPTTRTPAPARHRIRGDRHDPPWVRVHAHRAVGRHRHHRRAHWSPAAGRPESPRGRRAQQVPEPHETDRPGRPQLPVHLRPAATRRAGQRPDHHLPGRPVRGRLARRPHLSTAVPGAGTPVPVDEGQRLDRQAGRAGLVRRARELPGRAGPHRYVRLPLRRHLPGLPEPERPHRLPHLRRARPVARLRLQQRQLLHARPAGANQLPRGRRKRRLLGRHERQQLGPVGRRVQRQLQGVAGGRHGRRRHQQRADVRRDLRLRAERHRPDPGHRLHLDRLRLHLEQRRPADEPAHLRLRQPAHRRGELRGLRRLRAGPAQPGDVPG